MLKLFFYRRRFIELHSTGKISDSKQLYVFLSIYSQKKLEKRKIIFIYNLNLFRNMVLKWRSK